MDASRMKSGATGLNSTLISAIDSQPNQSYVLTLAARKKFDHQDQNLSVQQKFDKIMEMMATEEAKFAEIERKHASC